MNEIINFSSEKKTNKEGGALDIVTNLESFLAENKIDDIKKFLSDPLSRERLIYDRGRKNKNQYLFLDSFNSFLEESSGSNLESIDERRLLEIIHRENIPESVLSDLVSIAYHARDEKLFYKLVGVVFENQDMLEDKTVLHYVKHHLASWKGVVEQNKKEAMSLNDEVGEETDDRSLQAKAKYGRIFNSAIKIPEKAVIFKKEIIPELEDAGNNKDAIRAKQELAHLNLQKAQNIWNNLSKKDQSEMIVIDKLVEDVIQTSLDTFGTLENQAYTNAEIRSYELLADAYDFRYKYTNNKKDYEASKIYESKASNRKEILGIK
ncbi:MAG: hypothetical protein PF572_03105 [Patescibacteria group bacterium]|nr:hypothetical protein [Patescibacteria group bacterium]